MVTVRSVVAIETAQQWPIFYMDVHNVFQGDLLEDVYMVIPPGFSRRGSLEKSQIA